MRDFLTTGDLAQASGLKTTQQIRNLWNDGLIPAELINPGGKQLRFKKTQKILDWSAEYAARRRRPRRNRKQAREHLGVALSTSLQDLERQFELWRKQVGNSYRDWSIEHIKEARELMKPALDFAQELRNQLRRTESDHLA